MVRAVLAPGRDVEIAFFWDERYGGQQGVTSEYR